MVAGTLGNFRQTRDKELKSRNQSLTIGAVSGYGICVYRWEVSAYGGLKMLGRGREVVCGWEHDRVSRGCIVFVLLTQG